MTTDFDHFDRHGVYDLRIQSDVSQTLVVVDQDADQIVGYVAEAFDADRRNRTGDEDAVRVDTQRIAYRKRAVIGKRFVGSFGVDFDRYEFPREGPKELVSEVVNQDDHDVTIDGDLIEGGDD